MFFKNATFYALNTWGITADQLQAKLAARPFVACGASETPRATAPSRS